MAPDTLTVAPPAARLDDLLADALAEPGLTGALAADPARAQGLLDAARQVARAAFAEQRPEALDLAHRALYVLGAQQGWSPVQAARDNEHDLTLAAVRLELERGFEAQLAREAVVPGDMPEDPEAFAGWLEELALERPLPFDGPSMGAYHREHTTLDQLREIVAQRSLFFLKEPDPWTMVIPSLHGRAKAGLIDLILDEYGWGRFDQMHSTVYEVLMGKLGLETGYDHYFDRTSWQALAGQNFQAMYARHRRMCRRMYGYVFLVEAGSPSSMKDYLAAYARAGIDDPEVLTFYELHIDADEGHSDVALNEVVMPVVREEPDARAEIARGVVEGRWVHELFSRHLHACFSAGRSSLRAGAL
jgi:hypothetical protein